MSIKRKFDQLEDVTGEVSNAELHFGIQVLSPMKKSSNGACEYYNSEVTDGTKTFRLVGFDTKSHNHLQQLDQTKTPVKATNCTINAKFEKTDELEILVNTGTSMPRNGVSTNKIN